MNYLKFFFTLLLLIVNVYNEETKKQKDALQIIEELEARLGGIKKNLNKYDRDVYNIDEEDLKGREMPKTDI